MISGLSGSPADRHSRSDVRTLAEVGLDEHPPHRRRRAEGRDPAADHDLEQLGRVEAGVVVHQHGRPRQPGREEVAPGVLAPARGGDVQVDVARPQPHPVQGRQVADGVGRLAVLDQLGQGRGARGEVEQHGVVALAHAGQEPVGVQVVLDPGVVDPAGRHVVGRHRAGDDADLAERQVEIAELVHVAAVGDEHPGVPARHPVGEVGGGELRRGRDDHGAHPDGAEHHLPQRDDVAEDDEQPVAAPQPQRVQVLGHGHRALRELGEGQPRLAVALQHPEGDAVRVLVREPVEPLGREVEQGQLGPAESGVGDVVVVSVLHQEVAGRAEVLVQRRHGRDVTAQRVHWSAPGRSRVSPPRRGADG